MLFDVNEKNTLFTDRPYSAPNMQISAKMIEKNKALGNGGLKFRKRDGIENWLQCIPLLNVIILIAGTAVVLTNKRHFGSGSSLAWILVCVLLFVLALAVCAIIFFANYGKFLFGGKKVDAKVVGFLVMKKRNTSYTPVFEFMNSEGRIIRAIDRFYHKDVMGSYAPKLGEIKNIKLSSKKESDIFWKYPKYSMFYIIFIWGMSILVLVAVLCSMFVV